MEKITRNSIDLNSLALSDGELDGVTSGTSHFIATICATIMNTIDPTANCFVGDTNKVVCAK